MYISKGGVLVYVLAFSHRAYFLFTLLSTPTTFIALVSIGRFIGLLHTDKRGAYYIYTTSSIYRCRSYEYYNLVTSTFAKTTDRPSKIEGIGLLEYVVFELGCQGYTYLYC